jgi:putative ABC transport system permease protein
MINRYVIENLKNRWVRTLLSALVVGIQVMSILTLMGLSRGLLRQSAERAKGTGADIFLRPDTRGNFALASGQVSEKFVDYIRKQPHVENAVGVLILPVQIISTLSGVEFNNLLKLTGPVHFYAGHPPTGPDDLIVDHYYAEQHNLRIGETVNLANHPWHLAGVIQSGVLGRFIVPLATLQQLTGNAQPPRVSEILVKLDNPALTDQEVDYFNRKMNGDLQAISVAAFVSQFSVSNIPELQAFIGVVTALAVVVGFLVVFLSMYTAVVERTREIGILKALGAKPGTILNILVREALLLAIVGWIIGIALTYAARGAIWATLPASLPVINVPDWWPIAAAIAIAGALLGAIYPGLKAARQDAIEALAYE